MKKLMVMFLWVTSTVITYGQDYFPKPVGDLTELATWVRDSSNAISLPPSTFMSGRFIVNRTSEINKEWTVQNLVIMLPADTQKITLNAPVVVTGELQLSKGLIKSNNYLSVNFNEGYIRQWVSGNVEGRMKVIKTITAPGWHYIGTCLDSVLYKNFINNNKVASVWKYNEGVVSQDISAGWEKISDTNAFIMKGMGYACQFTEPGTIVFEGVYNNFNTGVRTSNSFTSSGNNSSDGWHLFSNPMPSSVDWNFAGLDNVDKAMYLYDGKTNKNICYVNGISTGGADNILPSLQAFWVHVSGTLGGTLEINAGDITYTNKSLLRKTEVNPEYMRITIAGTNAASDDAVIRFSEAASNNFDSEIDAYKLFNKIDSSHLDPLLFTRTNQVFYSVNSLPLIENESITVPLGIQAPSGTYELQIMKYLTDTVQVYLLDNSRDTLIHLGGKTTLDHLETDTVGRYVLILDRDGVITNAQKSVAQEAFLTVEEEGLKILNAMESNVQIYDILGNLVENQYMINDPHTFQLSKGFYLIHINKNGTIKRMKAFIR